MWAKANLFKKLKHLFKHSLNPRSFLRFPDYGATREGWQTPVSCCQTHLSKAPSWLPVLAHTSDSPSVVLDTITDATFNHWNVLLTMNIYVFWYKAEELCEGRDACAGNICCQGLRHSGESPALAGKGCKHAPLGQGQVEGSRNLLILPKPHSRAVSLCAASQNSSLSLRTASSMCLRHTPSGWGAGMHGVIAYLGFVS